MYAKFKICCDYLVHVNVIESYRVEFMVYCYRVLVELT